MIARGAGYPRAFAFAELDGIHRGLPEILAAAGTGVRGAESAARGRELADRPPPRWQTRTRDKVVQDLRGELGIGQP